MSRRRAPSHSFRLSKRNRNFLVVASALALSILFCCTATYRSGTWLADAFRDRPDESSPAGPAWSADSADLTIAASPLMAPVLSQLAGRFNALDEKTPDGRAMTVSIIAVNPEKMVVESLGSPPFQAISPDSSLWLDQLEQRWTDAGIAQVTNSVIPLGQSRTSGQVRYAVSPVVIAAWEDVARDLGWPDQAVGWQDIQQIATSDAGFKWNHSSTNTASGLLATLAEFYAGAGLVRGLTAEAATAQSTLDYVRAVEATIRFYGEGEEVIVERLAAEGRNFLDAFVGQERVVIDWNRTHPDQRLIAIYPAEGTLWTDHPLALLELGANAAELPVTDNQRLTYRAFAQFLTGRESQLSLLAAGYRPADLDIPLDGPDSPFASTDAVDWREPQTTLQMPPANVINVVLDAWRYTKRPTNVYLVVDTSGSMEGEKIRRTREALAAFVEQVQGDRDRVGIVEFASSVKSFVPLSTLDETSRYDMLDVIDNMDAMGGTALIDAVYAAVEDLQSQRDDQAINAVVVMTDGLDNDSRRTLNELARLLETRDDSPVVLFTIAFGSDADDTLLNRMADAGNGQFRRADETDIEELYRIISTYF
ncbi:MAG: VWA domain-containing protein [Chloroflexota bacterium]|nr:VWA domain-containing protein [Chloroflexota bacterium]